MMNSIEQHVEWIADLLSEVADQKARTVEATAEAEKAWTDHVADDGGLLAPRRVPGLLDLHGAGRLQRDRIGRRVRRRIHVRRLH